MYLIALQEGTTRQAAGQSVPEDEAALAPRTWRMEKEVLKDQDTKSR